MPKQIRYDRVHNPQLTRIQDSIKRGFDDTASLFDKPLGEVTPIVRADYKANFGEFIRIDMTVPSFNIILPNINPQDIGKIITVMEIAGGSNNVTIYSTSGATMRGSASNQITGAYGWRLFVAADTDKWTWMQS